MTELLDALNWRTSIGRAMGLIALVAGVTLLVLVSGIALAQSLGLPMPVVQAGIWALWLTWLGTVFPRNRRHDQRTPCLHPYRRAFRREILFGIAVAFSQLLRPAVIGLPTDERALPFGSSLAIGFPLLITGLSLVVLGVAALGIARTLFVHEYVRADRAVTTVGIFRVLRHPLFVGGSMASLGLAICTGATEAMELAALNVCVIPIYAQLEDRRCCAVLGPAYAEYRAAVGGTFPRRRIAIAQSALLTQIVGSRLPTGLRALVKTQ